MKKPLFFVLFIVLPGLMAALPARAFDYQIHGFAAQAYLLSEGNNYFGESTDGSSNFYEAAINGSANLGNGFLVSAQGLIRDAGRTDTGKARLDYALIDWNAIQGVQTSAGIRAGRVKNAFGLYNDTRDVIFARPGILLPSVYFDGLGLRGILFSSDGAQLYGTYTLGAHELSLTYNYALDRDFTKKERQILSGGSGLGAGPDEVEIQDLSFLQLMDSYNGGRVTVALSRAHARLGVEPSQSFPIDVTLKANLYAASLRYNAERYSLTGEYMYTRTETYSTALGDDKSSSDGGYVQADYRLTPQWSMYLRYDATFSDTGDRDGSEAGGDRYRRFSHDVTLGTGWRYGAHWGIWGEVHRIYGTATAPALDNPDGANEARWTLFTVMAGYRF